MDMAKFIGYTIWILILGALPMAAYVYYRTRRAAALFMVLGAGLLWGGVIADMTAEPRMISAPESSSGIQSQVWVQDSAFGGYAIVAGIALFLLGGSVLLSTRRGRAQ